MARVLWVIKMVDYRVRQNPYFQIAHETELKDNTEKFSAIDHTEG